MSSPLHTVYFPASARQTEDRRGQILQEVLRSQFVTVAALARQFGVSEVSIRRNLAQLEEAGLVKRVHGGAQAITRPGQPSVYDARLLQRIAEKRAIGRAAAALIHPGDTILLDSGTTVLEVARAIPEALFDRGGLTVVTRSLVIAGELRRFRQVRLIVLGGIYVHDFDDFVGPQVETALQGLHVNTLFIGTDGVSSERGLTTDNVLEAGLFRQMARAAERVVVVTDAGKIGAGKLQTILPFEEIHAFVTDAGAAPDFINMLRDKGVSVILASQP
ncbi:MAG: DeoR/GlpR family DNA-binding transcription regulator [Chloroflexi bacterium]|nr:DeoR/GlpR family DNA-binding transcription regulator [Chloroflexota bacterium]